jgi:hypothetical protein
VSLFSLWRFQLLLNRSGSLIQDNGKKEKGGKENPRLKQRGTKQSYTLNWNLFFSDIVVHLVKELGTAIMYYRYFLHYRCIFIISRSHK